VNVWNLNDLQKLQLWKLSQAMRICSKSVQSERDETVCVRLDSTKKGRIRSMLFNLYFNN